MSASKSKARQIIFKVFTVVGAITCGLLALGLVSAMFQCAASGGGVSEKTVLELRLDRPLSETKSNDPFAQIFNKDAATLHGVIEALDKAKDDERIAGVIAYVGAQGQGMARTQELRDAVARFRESGKFTVAFAETFGELSPGNQGYYLATAFEEVYLQPTGAIGLTGLMSEAMFVKGTLEKLEVTAQGDHRREYKNALNMFTERRFTDAHREAVQAILDDSYADMVGGIASARGLSEDEVRELINKGPFLGQEALDSNLVDGLAYRDEVLAKVKERAGEDATLLYTTKYLQKAGRLYDGDEQIAVIYGVGAVVQGPSASDPLSGESSMGSDTVAAAFRQAIEDEDVKAIVFRVDSPGGSAVASDVIWRETVRAKEAGKPVIVSMGNVAGSGGYYVACAADKIVASPSTITGSIGVLGGKPVTRRLWNKVGVTFDEVHTGENAAFFSTLHEYDAKGWDRLQAWLDFVYADFKSRVGEGRGLSDDQVEEIARGRIWSGTRALENGLVDELGGMTRAIELAKEAAEISDEENVKLVQYPRQKEFLEQLFEEPPDSSEDRQVAAQSQVAASIEQWRPVAKHIQALGLGPNQPGVLTMMPVEIGN